MKKYLFRGYLLLLLLLAGPQVRAQAPAWQAVSAINTSSDGFAYADAAATDAAGNVYVAGQFNGIVSLGSFSLFGTYGITTNGFVAKWSPITRSFIWAQYVGGKVSSLAVVGNNVYVAGRFLGTASFGSTTLTSAGSDDIFVAKLTDTGSSGVITWVKQVGGVSSDHADAIAASASGVYVAGEFAQTATFGSTTLLTNGINQAFITKLTDAGSTASFTWTQHIASAGYTGARGLAVAGSAVYVVGPVNQNAYFNNIALLTANSFTTYVAKLTDAGATSSFNWVQASIATAGSLGVTDVAVTGASVYLVGYFSGTATFGPLTLTTASPYPAVGCIVKLTDNGSDGTFAWAKQLGGPSDATTLKVAVAGNQVYAAGKFKGTAGFGTTVLTSAGDNDIFVARLTDTGSNAVVIWAQRAGGPRYDDGRAVTMSGVMPVVAGSFNATVSFGNQAIANSSTYSENAYLALLGPDVLATAPSAQLQRVVLYPNPTCGTATVHLPAGTGPTTLTLLDALGRSVRVSTAPSGQDYPFDLTSLTPGVYALRVQIGSAIVTRSLVVE